MARCSENFRCAFEVACKFLPEIVLDVSAGVRGFQIAARDFAAVVATREDVGRVIKMRLLAR